MTIKKFYGKSIDEARAEARQSLGNGFIILETTKADGQQPACITVMIEKKSDQAAKKNIGDNQVLSGIKNVVYRRSDAVLKPLRQLQKSITESTPASDSDKNKSLVPSLESNGAREIHSRNLIPRSNGTNGLSKRKQSFFEYSKTPERPKQAEPEIPQKAALSKDVSINKDLEEVKKKLNNLEKLLSSSVVLTNIKFISQPSFQQLLNAGLPAAMIAGWFQDVIEKGISPEQEPEKFMLQLAGQLRDALPATSSQSLQKNIAFVGGSGSGKTSLIMNLISNKQQLGKKKTCVVSVRVPGNSKYYTILEPFAKDHDIPFHVVSNSSELSQLVSELQSYDHVLFDTPSINFSSEKAFDQYWKLRQMLTVINPLEMHLVINANSLNVLSDYQHNNPLQPDFIDLTHMDEVHQWGGLIPIIQHFSCPVRFSSQGPADIDHFDTLAFANTLLSRS